ncbi:MAG: glycosyltransferase family 1 protein [Vicinamibacterales bacterium]|jgi:glycosyltransferase involved in cell wall biosynthesis
MRIAVDARELCGHTTGVGRYLSELLTEWATAPDAARHEWTLYAHAPPRLPEGWKSNVRVIAGSGGSSWEQWAFPRALASRRPDVVFAPAYSAPLTAPAPVVLTIHDVSFFAHPEWFASREGLRRRLLTAWSARRAKVVLTDTAFSQGEIARHIGLPASRVRVIPLGMRAVVRLKPDATSLMAAPPEPVREPIVLYVGSVFERRRVDQLIGAFDTVADQVPAAQLEIVGENRTRRPRLDLDALRGQSRHRDRIHIRSYVDDATLASLYARASVFAFLSEYEGFGLTPLEALAAGVPPVLLDTPVARETAGAAARYVPPAAGREAIAAALVTCLTNAGARRDILQQAPAVLGQYNWAATAARTLAAIEEGAGAR